MSEKIQNLIIASMELFNKVPSNDTIFLSEDNEIDTTSLFEKAFLGGVIISPNLINEYVINYINQFIEFDPNATFYNSFDEVISKDRLELFIDQIIHYFTTYGTNHTGEPFIVKNTNIQFDLTNHLAITEITKDEMIDKSLDLLSGNVALSKNTLEYIFIILRFFDAIPKDNSNINNREAKILYYVYNDIQPTDAEEIIRYINYLATKNPMVVKNRELYSQLISVDFDCSELFANSDLIEHAKIFNRYKTIYLALRHSNKNNKSYINRIAKLSKKYHVPTKKPWIETILESVDIFDKLPDMLPNMSNFKKIQLIETINLRKKQLSVSMYIIRNQKMFIKNQTPKYEKWYDILRKILYESLIESLKTKNDKSIKLPMESIKIALPTSEKSFIGNYPIGTRIEFDNTDAIIGINWRGEDGVHDLDLSYIDDQNRKIGWNSRYYDDRRSIIYSGDMTYSDPEASECLYAKHGFKDGVVNVNIYGHRNGVMPFKLFIAKEKPSNFEKNYMVNPNNIIKSFNLELDIRQATVGILHDNSFILTKLNRNNSWVSDSENNSEMLEYIIGNNDSKLDLIEVLKDAGFVFVEEKADIDLNDIDKTTLLNLFKNG